MNDPILDFMMELMIDKTDEHSGDIVLLSRTGSRAYGTDNEDSDHDFRGVYVASLPRVLSLGGVKDSIDIDDPHDAVVYELAHFARLAAKANPTALELLWSDAFRSIPVGDYLRRHRKLFLSKRVLKTYGGYALSQIEKAKRGTGGSRGQDHHKRMKFKLHTLRLLQAGIGVLANGEVTVKVDDPEYLFRMADQDIEQVELIANELLRRMDHAAEFSLLPDDPDMNAINRLVFDIRMGNNVH